MATDNVVFASFPAVDIHYFNRFLQQHPYHVLLVFYS